MQDMAQNGSISIHALREEGDFCCSRERMMPITFLSTPSAKRATIKPLLADVMSFVVFLSTPSVRRATVGLGIHGVRIVISIHALREEGDYEGAKVAADAINISIHALRKEGDVSFLRSTQLSPSFLSTPSARRATAQSRAGCKNSKAFLSTPSARRATT